MQKFQKVNHIWLSYVFYLRNRSMKSDLLKLDSYRMQRLPNLPGFFQNSIDPVTQCNFCKILISASIDFCKNAPQLFSLSFHLTITNERHFSRNHLLPFTLLPHYQIQQARYSLSKSSLRVGISAWNVEAKHCCHIGHLMLRFQRVHIV